MTAQELLPLVKEYRFKMNRNGMSTPRALLGLGEISNEDIANTVASMQSACPAASVVEAMECLFDNIIDCPDGVRLDILQMLCRISSALQKGLLDRTHKIIDKTFFLKFNIGTTAANTIVDPFAINDFKQITSVTNFITGGTLPTDTAFNISAITLKYGQKTTPAVPALTDPADVQYGLVEMTNTTSGATAVNTYRVVVPPVLLNGECTLMFGSTKILNEEPLTFMNNYNNQLNSIGYKRISNMFLCEGALKFAFQIKTGLPYTPPVGFASYLELQLNGAQVIKI